MAENEEGRVAGMREGPRQYGLCRSRFIEAEHRCISDGRTRKRDEGNEAREENRRGCWRRGGGGIHQPLPTLKQFPLFKEGLSRGLCYFTNQSRSRDDRFMDFETNFELRMSKKIRISFYSLLIVEIKHRVGTRSNNMLIIS